jgi:hypothetical protein
MARGMASPRIAVALNPAAWYFSARRYPNREEFAMSFRQFAASLVLVFIAQTIHAEDSGVQTAIHTSPLTPPRTGQLVEFAPATTIVGEKVLQRVGMELNLHTVIKQSGKVAHDGTTALRRRQERTIEVVEVVEGRARQAKVSYALSRVMAPENNEPTAESTQPVEGKTYFITRQAERLLVTDSEGAIPTQQEYEIVVNSMDTFGQPNPLAQFLLSKQIRVGERLEIPQNIAGDMMGFDSLGEVQKFELLLSEVKSVNGKQCAVFVATIVAQGKPENPLNVQATGNVVIELATCRTLEATLSGPLAMQSTDQKTEYSATGDLLLAIRSQYSAK